MTEGDRARGRQRGFTLIELMIALVVSSLLVGMILAIFSRISVAYRGQQQIAGVQQVLAAARAMIELDAKQAGLAMPQGFTTAAVAGTQVPVQVTDGGAGPDQIAFFYADTTVQAAVEDVPDFGAGGATVTVKSSTGGFADGDLVVLSTVAITPSPTPPGGAADIATYAACVLQIAPGGITGDEIKFATVASWGTATNDQCSGLIGKKPAMLYRLVAHAYRIDSSTPARAALGPLQLSQTGGLLGDAEVWSDLAYGFTDLQTAMQLRDDAGADLDGDGDPGANWYSGANQTAATGPYLASDPRALLQGSISLVARTDRDVEGIATAKTPHLTDPAHPDNNPIGNHPEETLPAGNARIYRYTTLQVDFRNLGVGK